MALTPNYRDSHLTSIIVFSYIKQFAFDNITGHVDHKTLVIISLYIFHTVCLLLIHPVGATKEQKHELSDQPK